LDAFFGFLFFKDSAFNELKPLIPDCVMGASEPPAIAILIFPI